jgi:hypothetical protein
MVSPFGNPGSHEGPIAIKTNAKTHKALQTEKALENFRNYSKFRLKGLQVWKRYHNRAQAELVIGVGLKER